MAIRRSWWAMPMAVLAVGLLVAGCSSFERVERARRCSAVAGVPPARQAEQDGGAAPEAPARRPPAAAGADADSGGVAGTGSLPALQDRQVIYTADLQLHLADRR